MTTNVEYLDVPHPLPEECEEVYSFGMKDEDLEKILNKIGHKISESIKEGKGESAPVPPQSALDRRTKTVQMIAGTAAIVTALCVGLNYVVTSAITTAMIQPGKDEAKQQAQLDAIQKSVDRLLDKSAKN